MSKALFTKSVNRRNSLLILVLRLILLEEFMKLFKETPVNDGYKTLQDDIKKTTDELQIVYTNLENVVEPDLIDYYIYQAKAVSMRYKFLLNCAKRLNEV